MSFCVQNWSRPVHCKKGKIPVGILVAENVLSRRSGEFFSQKYLKYEKFTATIKGNQLTARLSADKILKFTSFNFNQCVM